MAETPQRPLVRGPTFIRLLARLAEVDVQSSDQSLSDQLSEWIDWTRAVALSRVLDGNGSAMESDSSIFDCAEEEEACFRTRCSLASVIAGSERAASRQPSIGIVPGGDDDADASVDYMVFRQHYHAMQRAMQTATGQLRRRLRDRLATTSADLARLAEVDALMELVLNRREHRLLSAVPNLLAKHFERLRQGAHEVVGNAPATIDASEAAPNTWLDVFRKDMQGVLLAELDVRFLPLEGLLAALRTYSQGRHVQTFA